MRYRNFKLIKKKNCTGIGLVLVKADTLHNIAVLVLDMKKWYQANPTGCTADLFPHNEHSHKR